MLRALLPVSALTLLGTGCAGLKEAAQAGPPSDSDASTSGSEHRDGGGGDTRDGGSAGGSGLASVPDHRSDEEFTVTSDEVIVDARTSHLEERHGRAGALRTWGYGGHFGAPM